MELTEIAGQATVWDLFCEQARRAPDAAAIDIAGNLISYGVLETRARKMAQFFLDQGVQHGDRVAILSENCPDYVTAELACGAIGAILACQNWRLETPELRHCIDLVAPKLLLASTRYIGEAEAAHQGKILALDTAFETRLTNTAPLAKSPETVSAENGIVILYTSGTTGLPKGALISHRAMIARMSALWFDCDVRVGDNFIAWAPMFHMASTDQVLGTLMSGGTIVIVDGLDVGAILDGIEAYDIGWFTMMPGAIEPFIEGFKKRGAKARRIACVGAMADLVPRAQIAELTTLLNAPYLNSFGSTETGLPPATHSKIAPGATDYSLSKKPSSLCQIRLVDEEGLDVQDGMPGELAIKGPTVFSGYWNAPQTNAKDFRNGWFHMGDLFQRNPDGTLDFVDRAKYLIKSGGENIYPAEIERILLADTRIADAVVLRKSDPNWGETPVAFVALNDQMSKEDVLSLCDGKLAKYKHPSDVRFIPLEEIPRSSTGKIQRHEMEAQLL